MDVVSRFVSRGALGLLTLSILVLAEGAAGAAPPPELRQAVDLVEAGDFGAARGRLEAARVRSSGVESSGGWVDYLEGRILLAEGDVEESIDSLLRATEESPDTAPFRRWLGEAFLAKIDSVNLFKKRGVAKQALAELQEASRLEPGDFGTRETLVGYYLNAPGIVGGGDDKAIAEAREFGRLDAGGGHRLMAQIKLHHEDFDAAIEEYRAAARSRPDDARLRFGLGMSLQGLKLYTEAFSAFEKAIELDPSYMNPYYQLGRTAIFSQTNLERATESMQTYLDRDVQPGSPAPEHAHWRLGMIYALRGDDAAARRELEAAIELDPNHDEAKKALKVLGRS